MFGYGGIYHGTGGNFFHFYCMFHALLSAQQVVHLCMVMNATDPFLFFEVSVLE